MELLEFTHGEEPIKNRELFGLLGEYIASPAIRETLGGRHQLRAGPPLVRDDGRRDADCGFRLYAPQANGGLSSSFICSGGRGGHYHPGTLHSGGAGDRRGSPGNCGLLDAPRALFPLWIQFRL